MKDKQKAKTEKSGPRKLFTGILPGGAVLSTMLLAIAILIGIIINTWPEALRVGANQPQLPPAAADMGMPESRPAPQLWQLQGGGFLMEAHTSEGEFKVKQILFSAAAITFFYSMKLNLASPGSLQAAPLPKVTATSTLLSCDGKNLPATPLTIQLQSLGKLGEFEIGVIRITDWKSQPGQLISLKVQPSTPDMAKQIVWELPALQQLNPISATTTGGVFLADSGGSPNVVISGFSSLNYDPQASFFWLDDVTKPVYSPPLIFIKLEQADKVTVISQQEYVNIAGPLPQIYNRADQYPATPTLPGYTPLTLPQFNRESEKTRYC